MNPQASGDVVRRTSPRGTLQAAQVGLIDQRFCEFLGSRSGLAQLVMHGCLFDPRGGGQGLAGCLTLAGSFSAVWTATIATKDAFYSMFQILQDLPPFATL